MEESQSGFEPQSNALESDFKQFFREVYDGRNPYQWQLRLLRYVASNHVWPEALSTPTGSGKTSVIDIHVFLNSMVGEGVGDDIPRRLIMTINRRALVDDQYLHALNLRERIKVAASKDASSISSRVWEGLIRRGELTNGDSSENALHQDGFDILDLRGGDDQITEMNNDWRARPNRVAVICATPDMFGSRLLFRGYGVGRQARPIEAGLFGYDTVVMLDEAHLNRQLVKTARQVTRIESMNSEKIGITPLQVMEASATLPEGGVKSSIEIQEDDFEEDNQLFERMSFPKPVTISEYDGRLCENDRATQWLVDRCVEMHDEVGGTVGCVLNTVKAASELAKALSKVVGDKHVLRVVGRMRPFDRNKTTQDWEAFFSGEEDVSLDYVVGTQTLEVGMDVDLFGLVTELSSGSSLAQRAGRVNRFARRSSGPVHVIVPEKPSGPYFPEDLTEAQQWIEGLSADEGMSPWALCQPEFQPPEQRPRRCAYERLERWNAEFLSHTSEELAAETPFQSGTPSGLDLWLEDSFEEDHDASVVLRFLPRDEIVAANLLDLLPMLPQEKFPVDIGVLKRTLGKLLDAEKQKSPGKKKSADDSSNSDETPQHTRAFSVGREAGATLLRGADVSGLRPGDTVVFDATAPIFLDYVVSDAPNTGSIEQNDIYLGVFNADRQNRIPLLLDVPPTSSNDDPTDERQALDDLVKALVSEASQVTGEENDSDGVDPCVELFVDWTDLAAATEEGAYGICKSKLQAYAGVLADGHASLDYILKGDAAGDGYFIVVTPDALSLNSLHRETNTRSAHPITVEEHCEGVSERAADIAHRLNLSSWFVDVFAEAGKYHDEGKRDPRFQQLLRLGARGRWADCSFDLAKSKFGSYEKATAFRNACGLSGWRHEQRSAAVAWAFCSEDARKRELVTRLVGTNHGHGRDSFDDGGERLIPSGVICRDEIRNSAQQLFDFGEWERLMDGTSRRYGIWGMAYLEALLRAADVQVSSEGR